MEQTLQQQGEKVLQSLLEIVQNGLDKAPDYVLDFFNRFQLWVLLDRIIWVIIFGIIVYIVGRRFFKTISREDINWDWDFKYTFGTIVGGIMCVILSVVVIYYIHTIIQVSIMPELSLIEFLKTYH